MGASSPGLPLRRAESTAAPIPPPARQALLGHVVACACFCVLSTLLLLRLCSAPPAQSAAAPLSQPSALLLENTSLPLRLNASAPPPAPTANIVQPQLQLGPLDSLVTPRLQMRRSVVYAGGANARARRALAALTTGGGGGGNSKGSNTTTTTATMAAKPFKIGAVGGSITAGARASAPGANDWFSQVVSRAARAFPAARVQGRNGALSATPSMLMDLCLETCVDPDVDLVFVEYCANDGPPSGVAFHDAMVLAGYERLLRRLLALPGRPAVVLVQTMPKGAMYAASAAGKRGFLDTREDAYGALAQYYDLPWLSVRALWWPPPLSAVAPAPGRALLLDGGPSAQQGGRSPFLSELDDFHPNDMGHTSMADMVLYWMQQTAASLAHEPLGTIDTQLADAPLPPPAVPGNHAARNLACEFGAGLVQNAADMSQSRGFTVVDEGTPQRPKIGLQATEAGARLVMRINTTRSDGSASGAGASPGPSSSSPSAAARNTTVLVAYQQSWRPMGVANISCVPRTCACAPLGRVQAHVPTADPAARQTVAVAARLSVAPMRAACEIAVEVLSEAGPEGSHAFKVVGVMMSEYEGPLHVFGEAQ